MRGRAGIQGRAARATLVLALTLGLHLPAQAVVHITGDGSGNTLASPPADDPGISNAGAATSFTSIYLRAGWVLTARHVGAVEVDFGGTTYFPVAGSLVQLMYDETTASDLAVYRINGSPDLPSLPFPIIALSPPGVGEQVVAMGQGWNRQSSLTAWDANWNEVPLPGAHRGYKRGGIHTLRWGRNVIDFVDLDFVWGGWKTRYFATAFDEVGVPDEMQAVTGDSGGAVWVKRDGEWELMGIMFLGFPIDEFQPTDTAVFGNFTGAVDLSWYRDQILDATAPEIPSLPVGFGLVLAAGLLGVARLGGQARTTR